MVSIIGMPQFQAGPQGYNFQPLAAGIDTIRDQQNQNKMMQFRQSEADQARKMQREQMDGQTQYRNAMLEMQRQKMARGPERPWWAGANGQVDPAMLAKTQAGRAQNNVTVNGSSQQQETAFDKEVGKSYATMFTEGVKGGMKARKDLNDLNVLQQSLSDPNLYTGTGGQTVQSLKKAAQTLFGVPVAGVGAGELVDVLSKKAALALKGDLPGPLSNSDREYLNSLPPGLSKSPEGNRLIASLGILQKQYEIARQQAAVAYAKGPGRGRVDLGFGDYLEKVEGEYGQKFSQLLGQLRGMGEAQPRSPAAGVPLDALRKQYGLE